MFLLFALALAAPSQAQLAVPAKANTSAAELVAAGPRCRASRFELALLFRAEAGLARLLEETRGDAGLGMRLGLAAARRLERGEAALTRCRTSC
jgi:hypothetical protein